MTSKNTFAKYWLGSGILGIALILIIFQDVFSEKTTPNSNIPDLELGGPDLKQVVKSKQLAEGVFLRQIVRGSRSTLDYFTLTSSLRPEEKLKEIQSQLAKLGYEAEIVYSAENGPGGQDLGGYVQVGKFDNINDAKLFKEDHADEFSELSVRFTAENGHPTEGPFQISLLEIDLNKVSGRFLSSLADNKIKGLSTTSQVAKNNDALIAINGGYFAWEEKVGVPGDPAGISIIDGRLVSEAVAGRPALILGNEQKPKIEILGNVDTKLNFFINDDLHRAHGLNRKPGKVLNCGNPLDPVIGIPVHDFVCKNQNEVVIINEDYGEFIELDSGKVFTVIKGQIETVQTLNDKKNISVPDAGFLISVNGTSMQGISASIGDNITLDFKLFSDRSEVSIDSGMYAVNGGPLLVDKGRVIIQNRASEGWDVEYVEGSVTDRYVDKKDDLGTVAASEAGAAINQLNRADFYHSWVVRRHPRTAVGITNDNTVYLMTIYGRQPGISAGASITEVARALANLGAESAINLDGGGSTIMIVNGEPTGLSSDKGGQREVGDVLLLKQGAQ
jgi:hypothetical protein